MCAFFCSRVHASSFLLMIMMNEKVIDRKLSDCGLNLTTRLAMRTILFERPRLFPASWDDARWDQFEKSHERTIEEMQKILFTNEVVEGEDV